MKGVYCLKANVKLGSIVKVRRANYFHYMVNSKDQEIEERPKIETLHETEQHDDNLRPYEKISRQGIEKILSHSHEQCSKE